MELPYGPSILAIELACKAINTIFTDPEPNVKWLKKKDWISGSSDGAIKDRNNMKLAKYKASF